MSRYLEFTTGKNHAFSDFSGGGALHDGAMPPRYTSLRGVRVDGEVVPFIDPELPEQLLRSLRRARTLEKYYIPYDCVGFAALFQGLPLARSERRFNPYLYSTDQPVKDGEHWLMPHEAVNLKNDAGERLKHRSVVVPAYQAGETEPVATYLHKLPVEGPICLSGLQAALTATNSNRAYLVDFRTDTAPITA